MSASQPLISKCLRLIAFYRSAILTSRIRTNCSVRTSDENDHHSSIFGLVYRRALADSR